MIRVILLASLILYCNNSMYAQQNQNAENPTVVDLKSPDAMSLSELKFAEQNVNLYTGVPDINLPIYNYTYKGFDFPIAVTYDASGVKVNSIASYVGQNWSLLAGGSIQRVIKGKPDESGYQSDYNLIPQPANAYSADNSSSSFQPLFQSSAENVIDCQPDEFYFSFLGYSGKFVLDENQNAILVPYQDLKITAHISSSPYYFHIATPDGYTYKFEETETILNESCSDDPLNGVGYIGAWKLNKILFPNKFDELTIEYTPSNYSKSQYSETYVTGDNLFCQTCPDANGTLNPCISSQTFYSKLPSAVIFPSGKISINYIQDRLDVLNTKRLSTITIYNKVLNTYSLEKTFTFNTSYFNPSSANVDKRLKLDVVKMKGVLNSEITLYEFEYSSTNIEGYNSKAMDHWGYYNGKNNTSLIPNNVLTGGFYYTNGGNREVDPIYTQAAILKKIRNSYGGETEFIYENNLYGYTCNSEVNEPITQPTTVGGVVTCNSQNLANNLTSYFTVDYAHYATWDYEVMANGSSGYTCTGVANHHTLTNLTQNQNVTPMSINPMVVYLEPGNYKIDLGTDCNNLEANSLNCLSYLRFKIKYNKVIGYTKNLYGGGLRVKEINYNPGFGSETIKKEYSYSIPYETDRSSGKCTNIPSYTYESTIGIYLNCGICACTECVCNVRYITSNTNNSLLFANESSVTYSYVKVKETNNGYSLYKFKNDRTVCNVRWPFIPTTNSQYRNGLLLEEDIYNESGDLVSQKVNTYAFNEVARLKGWKASYITSSFCPSLSKYIGDIYEYISDKILKTGESTTQFYNNVGTTIIRNFYYDDVKHVNPTRISTTLTSNTKLWNHYRYAFDYDISSGLNSSVAGALKLLQQGYNNSLIEEWESLEKNGTSDYTKNATYNEYKIQTTQGNDIPVLRRKYLLEVNSGTTSFSPTATTVNTANITIDTHYGINTEATNYTNYGQPSETIENNHKRKYVYDTYSNVCALVENMSCSDAAYVGFEPNENANISFSATGVVTNGLTGANCYQLISANNQSLSYTVQQCSTLILSFWRKGQAAAVSVKKNGSVIVPVSITGNTISKNGSDWTFVQYEVAGASTIDIIGDGNIDEVRLYPYDALMSTAAFNTTGQVVAKSGVNGLLEFYEYDEFGQLSVVRDTKYNITKKYQNGVQITE